MLPNENNNLNHAKRKMSVLKKICLVLFGLSITFFIMFLSIPTLISSDWARNNILSTVNSRISGHVELEKAYLSWFNYQDLKGFKLLDANNKPILSFSSLKLETPLYELLLRPKAIGSLELFNLNAVLEKESDELNILAAFSKNKSQNISTPSDPIFLNDVNAKIHFKDKNIEFFFKGNTEKNKLKGDFHVEGTSDGIGIDELQNLKTNQHGVITLENNDLININAKINNFPVELLDQLFLSKSQLDGTLHSALGEILNLNIQQSMSEAGIFLKIDANSPNFILDLNGNIKNDLFTISEPGKVLFKITPEFLHKLIESNAVLNEMKLDEAIHSEIFIDQLKIPLNLLSNNQSPKDIENISMIARMAIDQANFSGNDILGQITLNGLTVSIEALESSPSAVVKMAGKGSQNGKPIQLDFSTVLDKPYIFDNLKENLLNPREFNGKGAFPVETMDKLFGMNTLMLNGLGSEVNFNINSKRENLYQNVLLNISSENLSIANLNFRIDQNINLLKPTTINFLASAKFLKQILKDSGVSIVNDVPIAFLLNNLTSPIWTDNSKKNIVFDPSKVILNGEITSKLVATNVKDNEINLHDFKAILDANPLSRLKTKFVADISLHDTLYSNLIGFKLNLSGLIDTNISKILKMDHFYNIVLKNNLISGILKGSIENNTLVSLDNATKFEYKLTPENFKILLPKDGSSILLEPANIGLGLHSIDRLDLNNLDTFRVHGNLNVNAINIGKISGESLARLQELKMPFDIDLPANKINVNFHCNTQVLTNNALGSLQGELKVLNWKTADTADFKNADFIAKLNMDALPVSFLETFSGKANLRELFGENINLDLDANLNSDAKGNIVINVAGQDLKGNANFKIDEYITLQDAKPITINYQITPTRFKLLRSMLSSHNTDKATITDPTNLLVSVNSLVIPWSKQTNETNEFSLTKIAFEALTTLDKFVINDNTKNQEIAFNNIALQLKSESSSKQVLFDFNAKQSINKATSSEISFKGSGINIINEKYELNLINSSLNISAKAIKLPAGILCDLAGFEDTTQNTLEAILGPDVDAEININLEKMNGPVYANLKGSNGYILLDSKIQNGFLNLLKPFDSQLSVTPKLSKSLLGEVIPFLNEVIGSEKPISIKIDPKNFSLPLKNFDINNIQLGQATFDLGKMNLKSNGQLGKILSLLNPNNAETLSVWFTPQFASMQNGVIKLERMDLLIANTYPIATWGKIDLARDKVNLIIGLTAQALSTALNLKNLDNSYMMQIPFKGKIGQAGIDKGKAAARISALVAQGQGGSKGLIVGTILDIAGGGFEDEKVPASTTSPLPWPALKNENNTAAQPSDKSTVSDQEPPKDKKKSKAKDQIEKAAGDLLKNIFGK